MHTTRISPQVFISYARGDADERARFLRTHLEREGFSSYVDVEDVVTGAPWKPQLRAAIGGCDILIALINDRFIASTHHKYGCLAEVRRVKDRGTPVMPVLLNGFQPKAGSELERLVLDSGDVQYQEWTDTHDVAFIERIKRHIIQHGVLPSNDALKRSLPEVKPHGKEMVLPTLFVAVTLCGGVTQHLRAKLRSTANSSLESQLWSITLVYVAVGLGLGVFPGSLEDQWAPVTARAGILALLCNGVAHWATVLRSLCRQQE